MKIRYHFLFTKIKSRINRTYGGEHYTLAVYRVRKVGKVELIGTIDGCSRSHKGEDHEAWGVCWKTLPKVLQNRITSHYKVYASHSGRPDEYAPSFRGEFGIQIDAL